jgi:hypothetical protein
MAADEQALLQRIATTLDEMLVEMRRASERHSELDKTSADAAHLRQNPFSNV